LLPSPRLILTGITADICVLLTAADAFLRDLNLIVPADCVASVEPRQTDEVLRYMVRVLDVEVRPAAELDLERLREPRAA
jgi:nicotinamidase-related amidase